MIYKLSHGSNSLTCNELFVIGKSMVGSVLQEIVRAINIVFRSLISCLVGQKMEVEMMNFKYWCGLPSMHGTINNTHISISKPKLAFAFVKDYYYLKTRGYSIVA